PNLKLEPRNLAHRHRCSRDAGRSDKPQGERDCQLARLSGQLDQLAGMEVEVLDAIHPNKREDARFAGVSPSDLQTTGAASERAGAIEPCSSIQAKG